MELSPENLEKIRVILGHKYFKQYSDDWVLNRSVEKYYERVTSKLEYGRAREHLKSLILREQKHECYYCHKVMKYKNSTLDHLVPLVRGGIPGERSNLVACHERCNLIKDDMTPSEFSKFIEQNDNWLETEL